MVGLRSPPLPHQPQPEDPHGRCRGHGLSTSRDLGHLGRRERHGHAGTEPRHPYDPGSDLRRERPARTAAPAAAAAQIPPTSP
jgi:hypothetical protein